jgi:lipopolysaccharide transport system ATP-binding protein
MSDIAVRVSDLGKRYLIGGPMGNQGAGRADPQSELLPGHFIGHSGHQEMVWALRHVSFELRCNEVVGIIGRNGSGKSTLLKILSRITEPDEGRAELYGRTASLLEVGTGFHPDLTGRENVYVNGSILGMKRREIDRKFDAIVEFSEIEKFIDTPIKRYSSGMGVRLAFAVAAHLDPEILMVDEVLAVGDLKFQRKCLDKMKEVVREGKTVLFVTHQMNAVRRLCSTCLWIDDGVVRMSGPTPEVVTAYEATSFSRAQVAAIEDGPSQFISWEIEQNNSDEPNWLETLNPFKVKFVLRVKDELTGALHGLALWNANDELMWGNSITDLDLKPGVHELVYSMPGLPLKPGSYRWHVSVWQSGKIVDEWYAVPELIIATEPQSNTTDQWTGILNIPIDFSVNQLR